MIQNDWHHLYGDGWKNEIVPESFAHPAKYSRALIRYIYKHLIESGYLHEGDSVLDPFGGVGLGALDAMASGLHWTGVELEPRFVALGQQNIDLWNKRYADKMPRWGTARLIQGDSRYLAQVIGSMAGVVSSPPYVDAANCGGQQRNGAIPMSIKGNGDTYGTTPGQLGAMKEGQYEAALSSPPFIDQEPSHAQANTASKERLLQGMTGGKAFLDSDYGHTPGQLAAMREGEYEASVSSPPYENAVNPHGEGPGSSGERHGKESATETACLSQHIGYSDTNDSNIGNSHGDTFWSSARQVVEGTHTLLKPNAVAVWVVKDFVRSGQIVPFSQQWQRLCEAVGFETLEVNRAWLVEDNGTQLATDGNHKSLKRERKSFFRRLAEKKGSPRIDYETVLVMRRCGHGSGDVI